MDKAIKQVHKWQSLFGRKGHIVSESPALIDRQTAKARVNFIQEELEEYLIANKNGDIVGILDAILDILYFTFGMLVIHGLHNVASQGFEIVHKYNMSKLWPGDKVKTSPNGKVLKPHTFKRPEPELKKLFEDAITQ